MRSVFIAVQILFVCVHLHAQSSSQDSVNVRGGVSARYSRPTTLSSLGSTTEVGGYADGHINYIKKNGLEEGMSMEMRHFNLFVFSSISPRIMLQSELEFEHGTEEISLEMAQFDIRMADNLIVRAGILVVPLGAFNQRHDSPLYEFIDRPLVSTRVLPATLSMMGFGARGRFWLGSSSTIGYDAVIVNGLGDKILSTSEQKTVVRAARSNALFEESNNGVPAVVARVNWIYQRQFEIGLSGYHGIYNSFRNEGAQVDTKRTLTMLAVDYSLDLPFCHIQGESAMNSVELPSGSAASFASKQWGSYLEAVVPVVIFEWMGYKTAQLNAAIRAELADYNQGEFSPGLDKVDDEQALSASLSLRPTPNTSIRLVYQHHWIRDVVGNPSRIAGFQFGLASYF